MIRSMTGFGRCETQSGGYKITVEIKSVNHRFFEFSARTPRSYGFLEERLKTALSSCISRGKIDVYVSIDTTEAEAAAEISVNRSLAGAYITALRGLAAEYGLRDDLDLSALTRYQDIFTVRKSPADEEEIWAAVWEAAGKALEIFLKMREAEGEKLKRDILDRSGNILKMVQTVEERSPQIAEEYREKLEARLKEMLADIKIDEQRLITETAVMADRTAVAEETVRLKSHIAQLGQILESGEPAGRKLDFLIQEFNREANTIGSKVQDVGLTKIVVEIKSEIEKIREQIQNIE